VSCDAGGKRQIGLQRAAIPHNQITGETMNEDSTSRILATLERLEAGQANIRDDLIKTRADIMERIDRLQNTVTPGTISR
jgi:hypothetical protein